jgi:uncharacterized protein YggU (UPF0235/DUF167 family)
MGQIILQVVPNSSVQALEFLAPLAANRNGPLYAPVLKVRLRQKAEDGRANLALEKWLSALSGLPVRIVRGHTGRRKTVVFSPPEDEFLSALRAGLAREQK